MSVYSILRIHRWDNFSNHIMSEKIWMDFFPTGFSAGACCLGCWQKLILLYLTGVLLSMMCIC